MNIKSITTFVALLSTLALFSQTYITNTTVVDVENQKMISDQTVVINDDMITNVQASKKVKVPANANVIDGTGKYLMPGMTDAHIHFFQNGGLYARPDAIDMRKDMPYETEIALTKSDMEAKLRRYLQNGITTVIDVGATKHFLKQREDFTTKDFAPTIYITGPLLTTFEPKAYENLGDDEPFILTKTIEDGIQGVKNLLPYKPDFIKIWYIVGADGLPLEESARKNLPIVKAVIEEAHKNNLKVAVHATQRITAQLAVEHGADFLVHSVDDELITSDFVQLLKKNNTVLCPSLIVTDGYMNTFGQKGTPSKHELRTSDPKQLGSLLDLKREANIDFANRYKMMINSEARIDAASKTTEIMLANLKLLNEAGVTIATGTDAGNIGTMHASSYLAELKAMQKGGMSNWQILTASTLNGAKVLDKQNEFGTVTKGKKANLVLLDANPIEALDNITQIHRVINKGVAFKPADLLQDTPADLAQRQLNAYNHRDIEGFLEPYAEDVEVYTYPSTLQFRGKDIMRKSYASMFENTPNLYCELKNRIVQGNTVIDQERVQFGERILEAIAIYHIENGKIQRVYFIQ